MYAFAGTREGQALLQARAEDIEAALPAAGADPEAAAMLHAALASLLQLLGRARAALHHAELGYGRECLLAIPVI